YRPHEHNNSPIMRATLALKCDKTARPSAVYAVDYPQGMTSMITRRTIIRRYHTSDFVARLHLVDVRNDFVKKRLETQQFAAAMDSSEWEKAMLEVVAEALRECRMTTYVLPELNKE